MKPGGSLSKTRDIACSSRSRLRGSKRSIAAQMAVREIASVNVT